MTMELMARHNVTESGQPDGQVMLFVHGFGCDQDMWRRLAPAFESRYRVVRYDHLGAGGSDLGAYDSTRYASLDAYSEDLLDICRAMKLEDVVLVAHSVGAMMAILAAVEEPSRFARLVLVAPSPCYLDDVEEAYVGGFSRADIDGLLASLDSNQVAWANVLAPMVMGAPLQPDLGRELTDSFCRTDATVARDFARVTFLSDIRRKLDRVQVPSLILQCSDDVLAPEHVGRYMRDRMAGSTLVQLVATGHCPHVSEPAETAHAMEEYLTVPQDHPGLRSRVVT